MFVFRIAKGNDGGLFDGECPVNFKHDFENEIVGELKQTKLGQIPYGANNYIDFLHRELWNSGKLRQGWGCEGLDLIDVKNSEEDKNRWIRNYVIALKKYWNTDPLDPINGYSKNYTPCNEASGRMKMLAEVLLEAKPHDIIFIPKHSFENHHDDNCFTVCEIIGRYYFDVHPNYKDFGHTIIVRNLKTFRYGEKGIVGTDFLGQHQKGVSTIKPYYEKYNLFLDFLYKNYLSLIS